MNADLLVATLGLTVAEGAAAADALRMAYLEARRSFVTETVFSDPAGAKLQFLRDAMAAGYEVTLLFIGLAGVALSEARVAHRVAGGGHDVPTEKLARRYAQSLANLAQAMRFVPVVHLFGNSSVATPHRLVVTVRKGVAAIAAEPLPEWARKALRESGLPPAP